jgi:hypothetical protein
VLSFDGWSIMVPEPLPFPRAPYVEALAIHSNLLARYEGSLLSRAAEEGTEPDPFCFLSDAAGIIVPRPKGVAVEIVPRSHAVERMRKYHGIARELFLDRNGFRFPVVVLARGVVSLHTFEVVDPRGSPRLVAVSRDEVMEPQKQEHREEGPWTITRWVAHDREPRYAWRRTPTEPASHEEAAVRVMALRGALLREKIRAFLRTGKAPGEAFAYMRSSVRGDSILVHARGVHLPFTWSYPKIRSALEASTDARHAPVVLDGHGWAALLWIDPTAKEDDAVVPAIVEERAEREAWETFVGDDGDSPSDDEANDDPPLPSERPEAPPPTSEKPRRELTEIEVLETLERLGIEHVVDRLVTLTKEEVDREMAELGFDPELERREGPGLRERVVLAMWEKDVEEDEEEESSDGEGSTTST